jgi:hypothetical protein
MCFSTDPTNYQNRRVLIESDKEPLEFYKSLPALALPLSGGMKD